MFLHIGGNTVIPTRDIIGIFSYSSNENKITGEFLNANEEKGTTLKIDDSNNKSFIVTENQIYYSPIAANTLKKRAKLGFNSSEFKKLDI
ncbi:DUF370 domain-containing protein [Alkalicella caledoniensis]|uniref:DUF370 domain-containing protein n=1 Tax=Alkalicella caledoniensis TaxID=2731377 RepID=A0A7G9W8I3_ALKCA|nr:extracellular matrix/biofilm biosynthesis regulator RemA family protein [Alkalicella caledoniensis]QNO14995.1 DUF370 domain-containing protein [Alkalicella caledoniensis]